jgi:small conductance mechanosensitive channel
VRTLPGVITDDPEPTVMFKEFADSSVNATLYFWIDTQAVSYPEALDAAVKGIKVAFEKAGITIPYPIRTVYMSQAAG